MKEKNIKEKTQQKKKMGLTTKIFVALIAGAILGIILCYLVPDSSFKKDVIVEGILYVIGQGFIRLMKMLVVPLVFCSLVCGSMSIGDTKKLGTVGVRTLVFYLATTALAVSVALTVGNLINPGVGLDMSSIQSSASSVETMEATSLTDTILNIIPDNPINSLASGTMLQVIVFALIVGVILANDDHGTCTDRCILSHQQNLCKHRFQRIYPAGKIYDRCSPCTGDPVLRRIPDPAEDIHRTESNKIHQEIFPGYGICILNSYIQCHNPDVH